MRVSAVLRAMGYDEIEAASPIRVSLGPETTKDEITRFAETWLRHLDKHGARSGA